MRYVLGIDGGNSKTHALLADEVGHILGFGESGPSNHQSKGVDLAFKEIKLAIDSSIGAAELRIDSADMGCFCLAGADLPEDYALLQQAVQDLNVARSIIVKNDCLAALRAGISRPWGVVIICGSGFNAAGISRDGSEFVLPGLGSISGDWGGGGELSDEIIRLVMRAWDGRGKPTLLTRLVLEALQAPSEEALLSLLYHHNINHQQILHLTPLLFEAAETGDEVSKELIIRLGIEVGTTATALIHRLGLEQEDVEVVLGGSVFKGRGHLLINTATRLIQEQAPRARIIRPRYEPVVGAALLALEAIGVKVNEQLLHQLISTLPNRLVIPSLN